MNIFLATVLIGFFVIICILMMMSRGRKALAKMSGVMFAIAMLCGFTLYTIGYLPEHAAPGEALQSMLRGIFSTGRMFLVNDDYSYILGREDKQWLVENMWFQLIFWLSHVLALFVSVSAILSLFGRQLLSTLRLRIGFYQSTYIICCSENDSRALALCQNIMTHDGTCSRPDRKRLIVFICESVSEETREVVELLGGVALTYHRSEQFDKILAKAGFAYSQLRIGSLKMFIMPEKETMAYELSKSALAYAQSIKIPASRLSLYVVSETEWMSDKLKQATNAGPKYELFIFSQAELAARKLVAMMPPCQAANIVNGKASDDFTVMILGFGQLGKQVLRRFVMNGQFIGGKMQTIIVDKDLDHCFGQFHARYPGVTANYAIDRKCMDVRSEVFYDHLNEWKDRISYIVVALGDDVLNLEIANDLSQYFARHDTSSSRHIAVGVCDQSLVSGADNGKMSFFSDDRDIFSESVLIREETDRMAKAVSSVYNKCTAPEEANRLWYQSSYLSRESNRAVADFLPTMLSLIGYEMQNSPSPENFLLTPAQTELLAMTEHLRWNAFHHTMGFTTMSIKEMHQRIQNLKESGQSIDLCRIDTEKKQHICLVPWDELDALSSSYNNALRENGVNSNRDFKQNDIDNVQNIPLFTKAYHSSQS